MNRAVWLGLDDGALLAQCEIRTVRGSGPGGQHRNKTESAVRIVHRPSGTQATAEERRSQHENRAQAVARLRAALAFAYRQALAATWPSPELRAFVSGGSQALGARSRQRVPFYLAIGELLDGFAHFDCHVARTAAALGITSNALTKLLFIDERSARATQELRSRAGQKALSH